MTLFWYGSLFGLMASTAPCFLGKLVKTGLSIFIQRSYCKDTLREFNKAPLFHPSLGPRAFLSLSLYFWLFPWSAKAGCAAQGISASFLLSLSHRRLRTTRLRSIKGPQQLGWVGWSLGFFQQLSKSVWADHTYPSLVIYTWLPPVHIWAEYVVYFPGQFISLWLRGASGQVYTEWDWCPQKERTVGSRGL